MSLHHFTDASTCLSYIISEVWKYEVMVPKQIGQEVEIPMRIPKNKDDLKKKEIIMDEEEAHIITDD